MNCSMNMATLCYDYEIFIAGYISNLNKNDSRLMYIFNFFLFLIIVNDYD